MIVLNLYILDRQIHVKFVYCCQQPIQLLAVGIFLPFLQQWNH